jgi:heat shock protein HtpX
LRPIFKEVYETAKANTYKNLDNSDIDIYIIDSMTVNACAIGKHTVAVTKGAVNTFSEVELKAILAHEIAHISNTDTLAQIYAMIGNGIFTLCILLVKSVWWLLRKIPALESGLNIVETVFDWLIFLFMFLMQIVMSVSSRKAELRADSYTVGLGYGMEMVGALYTLEKMSLGDCGAVIEKLLSSHPRVTSRIEALEIQLGIQSDETQ